MEKRTAFYLLIAAAIVYNLILAFSNSEKPEKPQHSKQELTLSPNLD